MKRLRAAGYARVSLLPPGYGYPATVSAYRGNESYEVQVWSDAPRAERHAAERRAEEPEIHILVIDTREYFGFVGAQLTPAPWPLIRQFISDAEGRAVGGSSGANAGPTGPASEEPNVEVSCGAAASGGTLSAKGLSCDVARRLAAGYLDSGFEPRGYSCAADRIICWRGSTTYDGSSVGFVLAPSGG